MCKKNVNCYVYLDEQQRLNLNKDFAKCFGELLKDACEKRGLTYRELAFLSGIDLKTTYNH